MSEAIEQWRKIKKDYFQWVLKFSKTRTNLAFVKGDSMVFVNNPGGLHTTWNATFVVNKILLCGNESVGVGAPNLTIFSGGFPEATLGCPVNPFTVWILEINRTKEKPFWEIELCIWFLDIHCFQTRKEKETTVKKRKEEDKEERMVAWRCMEC